METSSLKVYIISDSVLCSSHRRTSDRVVVHKGALVRTHCARTIQPPRRPPRTEGGGSQPAPPLVTLRPAAPAPAPCAPTGLERPGGRFFYMRGEDSCCK
ncbi:Hypothetical predicted protein [Marmota monax]|uniref:Uncharacterized protein n=1 Tax=Marmota monax TaxID=9995 RepID=A0A5E4BU99_MARMO|nr:hypothetical protein GHT09_018734 [Marmota monax]VTJ73208.1 Hypothetical predicted protein [Marmota monax]